MLNGKCKRLVVEVSLREGNKPTTRSIRDANDFVHSKTLSRIRKKFSARRVRAAELLHWAILGRISQATWKENIESEGGSIKFFLNHTQHFRLAFYQLSIYLIDACENYTNFCKKTEVCLMFFLTFKTKRFTENSAFNRSITFRLPWR